MLRLLWPRERLGREAHKHSGLAEMTRRRVGFAVTALLVAVLGPVLTAGPAQAGGSVASGPHRLYDGCRDYAYQVEGSNPYAYEWDLDLTLYTPSGDESSFDYDYGTGSSFSNVGAFNVCDYEGVGTYVLQGTITWYDVDYNDVGVDNLSGVMLMSRQSTASALTVSDPTPDYNSRVRFKMKSTQETPNGWANNAYEYVALEVNCGTGWGRVRGSKISTDAYGKASLRYRWDTRKTCRVRTLTLATVNSAVSRSLAVKVNPN